MRLSPHTASAQNARGHEDQAASRWEPYTVTTTNSVSHTPSVKYQGTRQRPRFATSVAERTCLIRSPPISQDRQTEGLPPFQPAKVLLWSSQRLDQFNSYH